VLFASGDSTTAADLIPCCPQGLRLDRRVQNHIAYTVIELGMVSDLAGEFDLIHSHIDYLGLPTITPEAPM
jgi:hypothetical protein